MPTKFNQLLTGDVSQEEEEDQEETPSVPQNTKFNTLVFGGAGESELPSLQDFSAESLQEAEDLNISNQQASDPIGAFFEGFSDSTTFRPVTRPLRIGIEGISSLATGEEFDTSLLNFSEDIFEPRTPEEQAAFTTGEVTSDAASFTMGILGASRAVISRAAGAIREAPAAFLAESQRSNRRFFRAKQEAETLARFISSKVDRPLAETSLIAARGSLQRGSSLLDDTGAVIFESAMVNPRSFITGEVGLGFTGAVLGIGAGSTADTKEEAEERALAASIFGSVVNAPRLLIGGIKAGSNRFGSIISGMRRRGRRAEAFSAFEEMAKALGTDADALLKEIDDAFVRVDRLAAQLPEDTGSALREGARRLPVGSLTGNPALIAIERQAARRSLQARGQDISDRNTFISNLLTIEETLRRSGRPQDLRKAVKIRERAFDTLLSGRVQRAQERAASSFADLLSRNPGASASELRRQASGDLVGHMQDAMKEMRLAETSLYKQIAGDQFIEPTSGGILLPDGTPIRPGDSPFANLESTINQIADGLGEGSRAKFLNSEGVRNIRGFIENGGTVNQLLDSRSLFMDEASTLMSRRQPNAARKAANLGNAIQDVINDLDVDGLDIAKQFSRQLNDRFNRSFVGDLFERDAEGAFKITPELAIGALLRGDTDRAAIRLQDISSASTSADIAAAARSSSEGRTALREAVETNQQFLDGEVSRDDLFNTVMGFDGRFGSSVMDEVELFVRASAADFVKSDGTVDAAGFSRFVRDNEALFAEYPDTRQLLSDPENAVRFLERAQDNATRMSAPRVKRRAFGGLIGAKNPSPVMGQIIQAPDRAATIRSIANMAKKVGRQENTPEYMEGLKSTLLTAAFDNTRRGDTFRWSRYKEMLTSPVDSKNTSSLLDIMIDNQIISSVEAGRLLEMTNVGIRVERALLDPTNVDNILDETKASAIVEATASIIGSAAASSVATRAGVSGGAGSIVIPSTGARLAKKFFVRDRVNQVHDIIIEAAGNSGAFRTLMTEFDPSNTSTHELLWFQLDSFLLSAGLHSSGGLGDFNEAIFDLPPIPEGEPEVVGTPIPEEEQEPDFFDQLSGGQ